MAKSKTLGDIEIKDIKKAMLQLGIVGVVIIIFVLWLVNHFGLYSMTSKF